MTTVPILAEDFRFRLFYLDITVTCANLLIFTLTGKISYFQRRKTSATRSGRQSLKTDT